MLIVDGFRLWHFLCFSSCHVGPQAGRQPFRFLRQILFWVSRGIFSQRWILIQRDIAVHWLNIFQERLGSAWTSFTSWQANDLFRCTSTWLTMMGRAMWLSMIVLRWFKSKSYLHYIFCYSSFFIHTNAMYGLFNLQFYLQTGWWGRRICSNSGRVQRRPFNPWRLNGSQW